MYCQFCRACPCMCCVMPDQMICLPGPPPCPPDMRDGKNTCMMYCAGDYWLVNAAGVDNTAFAAGVPLVAGKMPGAKACDDNYVRRLFSSDGSVTIALNATMDAVDLKCHTAATRALKADVASKQHGGHGEFTHVVYGAASGQVTGVASDSAVQLNVLYQPTHSTTVTSSQSLLLCRADTPLPGTIISPMTTLDGKVVHVSVSGTDVVLSVEEDFTIAAGAKIAFTVAYVPHN